MTRLRQRFIGFGMILVSAVAIAVLGQPAAAATPTHHTVPNPLLKEQFSLGGDDDGNDDPAVSALCQGFLGKPTPFGPIAPNVDAINGDSVSPAGSLQGCDTPQNETTVAVNPANPRNIVEGSNDYRVFNSREARSDSSGWAYTSFDGGRTFKDVELPKLDFQTGGTGPLAVMDAAGDPALAFGPNNTVYFTTLVFSRAVEPGAQQAPSGIAVSVSHDGGLTWGNPSIVHLDGVNPDGTTTPTFILNDKEWIAADPRSGTVYVTWTQFTFDPDGNFIDSPIVVSASHDFGRTWSAMRQVSPDMTKFAGGITSFGSGSNPQVANNGTLFVAYETSVCQTAACDAPTDHDAVVMAASRNGGRTFTNTEVALDFDFPFNNDVQNNALTGENFRINSFPQLAYDRLTNHLWVTWADDSDGKYVNGVSVKTNGDAFLADSADGTHWSKPLTLGTRSDEVFPAVAALGNQVAVSFYTRNFDPNGIGLDYAFTHGFGRSLANRPVQRITTATSDPQVQFPTIGAVSGNVLQGAFIGDYTAMAIGADFRVHPTWTDFRGDPGVSTPNQDVVTQSIPVLP